MRLDDMTASMAGSQMGGILKFLLLTDLTLADLACARRQSVDELCALMGEAIGSEHDGIIRRLREAEQACAENFEEPDPEAQAMRHHWRRELAVVAVDAGSLPLPDQDCLVDRSA